MSGVPVLSIIVLAPVAASLLIALFGSNPKVPRVITLIAGAITLAGSTWVFATYDRVAGGFQFAEKLPWIPSLGASYSLGVDGISAPMLMLTSLVIFTGALVSWNVEERPREYFALLLLLVTGVFGVFAARDAFLMFFFYEMAVLPMYLLIAIWGSTRKDYSAMKLTLFLFAGSAVLMVLMVLVYWQVGAHTFDMAVWSAYAFPRAFQHWAFLLAFVGFGALIPIFPLHTWSPDGHVAAPTAVSMLHAGVLLKIGAYGLIRLGLMLFPAGWADWSLLIAIIGVTNIVYGALCAMSQTDLKYVLGYSSVSHMGYVLLGLAVGGQYGLSGAVFQMFAHGVMTGLFFALIGFVYEQTHTREIAKISGLMKRTPLVAACFVIAGASSMGLPSTAGFVAELLVYVGVVVKSPWFAVIAFVGVVVTAGYLLRMLSHILLGEASEVVAPIHDAPPLRFAPMAILAIVIMVVGVAPGFLYSTISSGVAPILQRLAGG
jgi:NADH-quinone oxidoreductase subunit M